jgi:hypothetical protein
MEEDGGTLRECRKVVTAIATKAQRPKEEINIIE